jgi:hypothetical protein
MALALEARTVNHTDFLFQIKYRPKLEIINPFPCGRNLKFDIEKFKDGPIDKDFQRTIENDIDK